MTRGAAAAVICGTTGCFRGWGGAQVPEALGKALQGRALGLLTNLKPGNACGSRGRCGGTFAVLGLPGRRQRVDSSRADLATA